METKYNLQHKTVIDYNTSVQNINALYRKETRTAESHQDSLDRYIYYLNGLVNDMITVYGYYLKRD